MDEICGLCKNDFNGEKIIGCEGTCRKWFHISCVNITKKQFEIFELVKGFKWFCKFCYNVSYSATTDITCTDGTCTETQNDIIKSIQVLTEKVEKLTVSSLQLENKKKTYATAAKNDKTEMIVVVNKEKLEVEGDEIKEIVKHNINPVELGIGVTAMRNFQKNGLSIECSSGTDRQKLVEELKNKIGENYSIKEAKIAAKKFKIVGIDSGLTEEQIINAIKRQNELNVEIKIIKMRETNEYNKMVIIEIATGAELLEGVEKLKIEWRICKVNELRSAYRCYNCYGFNHKAINCKNEAICSKCGSTKHDGNCNNETKCKNCENANEKFNTKVDTEHSMFDKEKCKVYQAEIEKQKKRLVLKE